MVFEKMTANRLTLRLNKRFVIQNEQKLIKRIENQV